MRRHNDWKEGKEKCEECVLLKMCTGQFGARAGVFKMTGQDVDVISGQFFESKLKPDYNCSR